MYKKIQGFTLAEVLITLGIIGVVAVITIPILMNATQEQEFKTGYKKAYSIISQALQKASNDQVLSPFSGAASGTGFQANFSTLKQYFSIAIDCIPSNLSNCWDMSSSSETFRNETSSAPAFIDKSGMAWRQRTYPDNDNLQPTILVDINGNKKPNKYGQDRFPLYFSNTGNYGETGGNITGPPTKMIPCFDQFDNTNLLCPSYASHPCYYTKWIYN